MQLGFKKEFKHPILEGTKIHTLRYPRKRPPKQGERIYMVTGARTKYCKRFSDQFFVKCIQKVSMNIEKVGDKFKAKVFIDGWQLPHEAIELLATNDGFSNVAEFYKFFLNGQFVFKDWLELYHWTDYKYHPGMTINKPEPKAVVTNQLNLFA